MPVQSHLRFIYYFFYFIPFANDTGIKYTVNKFVNDDLFNNNIKTLCKILNKSCVKDVGGNFFLRQ
jgi:hypothetical protein